MGLSHTSTIGYGWRTVKTEKLCALVDLSRRAGARELHICAAREEVKNWRAKMHRFVLLGGSPAFKVGVLGRVRVFWL